MSIAIVFNNKDPKPWAEKLKQHLPQTKIEVYPHITDWAETTFVLCWKPDKNVLQQFPNLQVIQSVGASVEHIINTQNIKENVQITRITDFNLANDMWAFLLASVMAQLRNFDVYAQQQALKIWQQKTYKNIENTTISILGLGKIGAYVAQKFSEVGFIVKGWSTSKKDVPNVTNYVGIEEFDSFLDNTNFLINLLPLTPSTENILNTNTFKKLNKGAFLINVGRGEHLVDNDLLNILAEEHLSGALLDVFRQEPLPPIHPFWHHSKIQITPHIASITNVETAAKQIAGNYNAHISGKVLQNIISLKKGY